MVQKELGFVQEGIVKLLVRHRRVDVKHQHRQNGSLQYPEAQSGFESVGFISLVETYETVFPREPLIVGIALKTFITSFLRYIIFLVFATLYPVIIPFLRYLVRVGLEQ